MPCALSADRRSQLGIGAGLASALLGSRCSPLGKRARNGAEAEPSDVISQLPLASVLIADSEDKDVAPSGGEWD